MTAPCLTTQKMTRRLLTVFAILALDLSICFGQFGEMGGMAGMAGMMGGLGAMMGGGMGGLMGGGGSGMGAGIGAMVRRNIAMNSVNEAVHYIVGPQASPDQPLIDYAMTQRSPPRGFMQMLPYLPHLQRIARNVYAPFLAEMATKSTTPSTSTATGSGTTAKPPTTRKSLAQLQADLDNIIMQKAIEYANLQESGGGATGGGMPGGMAAMGAMGAMIPAMIQGITAQYMR